jgi:hypothetical protein
MEFNRFFFLSFLLLATACTHFPPPEKKQTLFPVGTYQHQVEIHITKTQQDFQFQGVVNLSDEQLRIYLLGPMNVSAAKITEHFAPSQLQIEIQLDSIKKYDVQLKRLYSLLRSFILFPKDREKWGALQVDKRDVEKNILTFSGPSGIVIEIKKYRDKVPVLFEIRHPGFQTTVRELTPQEKAP